jgi:uncharacterized RDD family membrane protein YckC
LSESASPFPFDPPPSVQAPQLLRHVASFWRRFFAFLLDGIIINVLGSIIGLFFFDSLSRLGPWGRFVGFLVVLPYFAFFESRLGDGQSIGKRLLGLRVVNSHGTTISLEESLLRYFVFAIPIFLNSLALPISRTPWFVFPLLAILVFGVGGATLYLLIFNRNTRQGLHDLAAGTYVVEARQTGPVEANGIWKFHWIILGSLALVLTPAAAILGKKFTESGVFPQLLQDVRLIEIMDGAQRAGAQDAHRINVGSSDRERTLVITIFVTPDSPDGQAFADQIAKTILENDRTSEQYARLNIVIMHGYDLGFASGWRSNSFSLTPAEWNQRIAGTS